MSLEKRWNDVCSKTIGKPVFWTTAVDHRAAYAALAPLIEAHALGTVLDAGAGRLAWRELLSAKADSYVSLDYSKTHPDITIVADLLTGLPIETGAFDTVFCCSVLEHVKDPEKALLELARILKPGGTLILSVPFLYYLHGAPDDYFRFTPFGVRLIAERTGFTISTIQNSGGAAHQLLHSISMLTAGILGASRPALALTRGISYMLWKLARALDRFDKNGRFAQNVNAVLKRNAQ